MKKVLQKSVLLLTAIFSFGLTSLFAQVPQAINFQAIARDAESNPMVNTNIQIRLSVLEETPEGTVVYQELRALQTNAYGSFSFQIGRDANYVTVGTFENIAWADASKFLKIEYDPTNTFSFDLTLGTIEFVSVPYAFAAGDVAYIDLTDVQDGDALIYNEITGKFEPGQVAGGSVDWADVQNTPDFTGWDTDNSDDFDGSYNSLTDVPVNLDIDATDDFSGSYNDLTDVPANMDTDASDDLTGDWSEITSTPTTLSGYGITDAQTIIVEVVDEFAATEGQTTFTLSNTPATNCIIKLYINGVRISNSAFTAIGTSLEYNPVNNGNHDLDAGDRIQLEYYY